MYIVGNPQSKKEVKEGIAAGKKYRVYNPGPFGEPPQDGTCTIEGPHAPKPHKFYGVVTLKDGIIVSIK